MKLSYPENCVALVTGAGRGIGKAIAEVLAKAGMEVICISKSEESCGATAAGINDAKGKATALAVDVSDPKAVLAASKQLLEAFGCINILVNGAGITKDKLTLRMKLEDWHEVMNTNLSSCFYWLNGLVTPMVKSRWGRIVNISSVIGVIGNAGQSNYAASKAGMIGYSQSLARELASRNITVNVVAPGFIETDMTAELGKKVRDDILQKIPLQRLGKPSDIASMVAYLCSEEANYITGQVFRVDGGMVM